MRITRVLAVFVALLAMTHPCEVSAQAFDAVGTRARGMGGAFVAVADDASATWWNPAGLASGAYFNTLIERGQGREPDQPGQAGPGLEGRVSSVALAYPAMGLSYYRTTVSSIAPLPPDRQDRGTQSLALRSLSMTSFGATFGQSVGRHIVLASTVRLARAGSAVAEAAPGPDLYDRANELDSPRQTFVDLDLGAMLRVGSVRFGASLKHVGEPTVGTGPARLTLERQGRAGLALLRGKTGLLDAWTVALDTDLTRATTVFGEERRLAAGGEAWLFGHRVGLRAGVSTSTVGVRRTAPSTGASVALRRGLFVDGAFIPGSDQERSGWSVSLRSAF